MSDKTILVTGGAGFMGSNFVWFLHRHRPDYRIIILDSLTYAGSVRNLPEQYWSQKDERRQFWYGSVTNAELVNSLVAQADLVVHFAAETHVTRSIFDNLPFVQTDVMGTQIICNAVLKHGEQVERLVHISTSEVYGTSQSKLMDEDHPLMPQNPYAAAKTGADRLVHAYWATYGIPAVIVRPFNNYGPYQHLEKVVPRFITSAILGEPLTVHGQGVASRDFLHVEDCCRGIFAVLHAPHEKVAGETFNLASGETRTILSIAEDVASMLGYGQESIQFISERPGQVIRHRGDAGKVSAALGWSPARSWREGMAETIDWYQTHQDWWQSQLWMRRIPIMTANGRMELH